MATGCCGFVVYAVSISTLIVSLFFSILALKIPLEITVFLKEPSEA